MEKTEEMQDLFKRRGVSEEAKKIILENDRSVLREIFQYMEYEYYKESIENERELSERDKLTEKSVREIAEKYAYDGEEDSNLTYWDNIDSMIDKYGVSAKYELTDETMKIDGHILHRIRALRDFGDVEEGDLGGFIENEDNLSHEGDCWIYNEAYVRGNAKVYEDAMVYDNVGVYDDAEIYGDAKVIGDADVSGRARIFDCAEVRGYAEVLGDAKVCGEAIVCGDARVTGNAEISEGEISEGRIDGSEKKNIELD